MVGMRQALLKAGLSIQDERSEELSEFHQTCFLLSCLNCFIDFSSSAEFSDYTKDQFLGVILVIQTCFEASGAFSVEEKLQWRPVLHNISRVQAIKLGNKSCKSLHECLQGMHDAMSKAIASSSRRIVSKFDKCGYNHQHNLRIIKLIKSPDAEDLCDVKCKGRKSKEEDDKEERETLNDSNGTHGRGMIDLAVGYWISNAPPKHFLMSLLEDSEDDGSVELPNITKKKRSTPTTAKSVKVNDGKSGECRDEFIRKKKKTQKL